MDRAYKAMVEEALIEDDDPYNGSISTTNGVKLMTDKLMTADEADAWSDVHMDDVEKWEEAGAIPLKAENGTERIGWFFFFWGAM
jgi:hypothetical protein